MKRFLLMIQFLTRIPLNMELEVDERDFSEGIIYFPLVGLIIGLFIVAAYTVGLHLGGILLAAVMAVTVEVFISGGLHLDGLGDTFDGVYSNRPREQILEIMKDSRLGTNAALAIILILMLKIALISSMQSQHIYSVLLLMPVFSRLSLVFGSRFSKYARKSGMGNLQIEKTTNRHVFITCTMAFIFSFINPWTLIFLPILFIFSILYIQHITGKIGGMTGDTLGALCELSEIVYLSYFLILIYLVR
ncbi:MAG: adenosylcobinamide-GDP ribazoletransferase [Thermotaleaceae bacterium]